MKKATLYSLLISSAVCFAGFEASAMEEDPWRPITSYLPKKALVDNGLNVASSLLSMLRQDPETKKQQREIRKEKSKQRGKIGKTKIIAQTEKKPTEWYYEHLSKYLYNQQYFASLGSPLQGMPKDL